MAETRTYSHHRPFGVTLVVVLMFIQGIFEVLAGLGLLLERNDLDLQQHLSASDGTLTALGILILIAGAVTILLATMLGRGSNFVRLLVGIVSAFNLGSAVWGLIAFAGTGRLNSLFQAIVAGIVLYLLFGNRESQEYFAG
jgi:hypothetical protein